MALERNSSFSDGETRRNEMPQAKQRFANITVSKHVTNRPALSFEAFLFILRFDCNIALRLNPCKVIKRGRHEVLANCQVL